MRLLDRHIVREYLRALIAVALVLTVVTLVSIVLEHVDDVFEHGARVGTSLKWFTLLLPHRLIQTVPVMVLLGVMFSVGTLSRHNEIIAIISTGISRARVFVPVLLVTGGLVGLTLWFNEEIVPWSSALAERTERVEIEGKPPPTQSRNIFLRGATDTYYWLDAYLDYPIRPRMVAPVVLILSGDRSHVIQRIEARWATYVRPQRAGGEPHWSFRGGTHWTFNDEGEVIASESFRERRFPLEDDLTEFLSVRKAPEEMNFRELRRFIRILEQRPGVDLDEYRTELHLKVAFPLALVIVAMMAFPCAMKTRVGSLFVGFSLAIVFLIAFYTFTAILRSLGHEGHLWPWFAAWAPDVVFLVAASYFLGLWRT